LVGYVKKASYMHRKKSGTLSEATIKSTPSGRTGLSLSSLSDEKKEEYLSLISAANLNPNSETPRHCKSLEKTPPFFVFLTKSPKLPLRRVSSHCLCSSRCCFDCESCISFLPLALLGSLGGPLLGARGGGPVLASAGGTGGGGTSTVPASSGSGGTSEAGSGSIPVTTGGGETGLDSGGGLLLSTGDELLLLDLLLGLGLRVAVCCFFISLSFNVK
jgi:hypothetical protein